MERAGVVSGVLGRGVRERLIASLAINERAHVAALAESIRASNVSTGLAVRFFEERGLVRVDRSSPARTWVALAPGPLREPLLAFGRRVAEIDGVAKLPRRPRSAPAPRPGRLRVGDLFVTETATRILMHVAETVETDATELHRLLGIDEAVVRVTVTRLVKDGILRREARDWKRVPLRLAIAHPAAPQILGLLRAVIALQPEARAVVRVAGRRRTSPVPTAAPKKKYARTGLGRAADLLPLFHPAQARVLAALASCGPLNRAALARRIGVSPSAIKIVGGTLTEAGLVSATKSRGGTLLVYELDPSHPLAPELWSLLAAACRSSRLRVAVVPSARLSPCAGKPGWPPDHRGRAALALALSGASAADLGRLSKTTSAKRGQTADRIGILRDANIVTVNAVGGTTTAELAPKRLAAETLALLDAMRASGLVPADLRVMGDVSGVGRLAALAAGVALE